MCANYLQRQGIEYDIIDKKKCFSSVGFELLLWPTTVNVLKDIGISDAIAESGVEIKGVIHRSPSGSIISRTSYEFIEKKCGPYVVIERDRLLRNLEEQIGVDTVLRNTWVTDIENSSKSIVKFSDGSSKEYDLVIGADGINSWLRSIIDEQAKVVRMGYSFWLYRISRDVYSDPIFEAFSGKGVWGILSPGKVESVVALVTKTPSERTEKREFLRTKFKKFQGNLRTALNSMPEDDKGIFHWEALLVKSQTCQNQHAVLIGDAAHGHPPSLSSGANLAIEDSQALTRFLIGSRDIPEALKKYERSRRKRVSYITRLANITLRTHMMNTPFDYITAMALKLTDGTAASERMIGLSE
jgi:2-polyprenyl-6-methoxyphenol hydroxylase-like FAD-dependent oxidoreductase